MAVQETRLLCKLMTWGYFYWKDVKKKMGTSPSLVSILLYSHINCDHVNQQNLLNWYFSRVGTTFIMDDRNRTNMLAGNYLRRHHYFKNLAPSSINWCIQWQMINRRFKIKEDPQIWSISSSRQCLHYLWWWCDNSHNKFPNRSRCRPCRVNPDNL